MVSFQEDRLHKHAGSAEFGNHKHNLVEFGHIDIEEEMLQGED